jgi:hypothetical protein
LVSKEAENEEKRAFFISALFSDENSNELFELHPARQDRIQTEIPIRYAIISKLSLVSSRSAILPPMVDTRSGP